MKKLAFATLLLIISCSRNSDNEKDNTTNPITVKKIEITDTGYDYSIPTSSKAIIDFTYINKINISRININVVRTNNSSTNEYKYNSQIDFSYIDNKLNTVKSGGYTMKFNYTSNKLSSIDYINVKGYNDKNAVFYVHYNNNRIDYIDCDYPYYYVKNKFNYSPSNKLNSITIYKDNSLYKTRTITLDDKNNPFKNISEEEKVYFVLIDGYGYAFPFDETFCSFFGDNNVTSYLNYKFTYTYNSDNFPSMLNMSFPYNSTQNYNAVYKFTY